ncbi:MAG: sulfite exporter TauE/SafE family protein [Sphaerochaetaceae bacterium]|nr:sulfite exporter TauE/SafE family protein [Sphaerochaetaceae bacterium]
MSTLFIISIVIFIIAITMSMVGKGGGNFYVLVMVLAGISMHNAATTSQLIMMGTSLASMLIFHKNKRVDWKLALVIDPPTDIMAFFGGYFASSVEGTTLKLMFAGFLILISIFMYIPVKEKPLVQNKAFGRWNRHFGEFDYSVNLWLILPITATVGFFSGAIGISGGAFKIPMMVMLCGIPMSIAVGTSSAMVAATALMGFIGHSINGDFNPSLAIPLSIVAILGGIIGGKFALKSKPKNLKKIFATTNLIAAIIMIINILS